MGKDLSAEEQQAMKSGWNGRHQFHFSRNNAGCNPATRDYFDRPRDDVDNYPGVKPRGRWRPTWSLSVDRTGNAPDGSKLGSRDDNPAPNAPRRREWNDRHHVTHSASNLHRHDGDREYFSRHTKTRNELLLPLQPKGIMKPLFPHAQRGNPDGCDD